MKKIVPMRFAAALCMIGFGLLSMHKGVDINFDLQNYHFYNPWAFLHDRYLTDVAAAKTQTFFNPAIDFIFYGLVALLNDWPGLIAFAMGALHGLNAVLLIAIARLLFAPARNMSAAAYVSLVFLSAAIGVTGAGFQSLLGITMGDLFYSIPVLGALFCALKTMRCGPEKLQPYALGAGLCIGLAFALKLIVIIYVVGLGAAALLAFRHAAMKAWPPFTLGAMIGFAIGGGWFFASMYREFGNPVFPMLNDLFKSPFANEKSFSDITHLPETWAEWAFYPFFWAQGPTKTAQQAFKDPRIAAVFVLAGLFVLAELSRMMRRRSVEPHGIDPNSNDLIAKPELAVVALFCIASYVAWIGQFAIYRYLVVVEMLAGPLIVALLAMLWRRPLLAVTASAFGLVVCLYATQFMDWGHVAFGRKYIDVEAVPIPADSTVLLTGYAPPLAHMVPFLNRHARYVKFDYKFLVPGQTNRLAMEGRRLVQDKGRALYTLRVASQDPAVRARTFADLGLDAKETGCTPATSNLVPEPIVLCAVERYD